MKTRFFFLSFFVAVFLIKSFSPFFLSPHHSLYNNQAGRQAGQQDKRIERIKNSLKEQMRVFYVERFRNDNN